MRRARACSLTFCSPPAVAGNGAGGRERKKGREARESAKRIGRKRAQKGTKKEDSFLLCPLCPLWPLWQLGLGGSLLPDVTNGQGEGGLTQVVDFHDYSRKFHSFSLSVPAVWSHPVAPSRTQSHPVAPSRTQSRPVALSQTDQTTLASSICGSEGIVPAKMALATESQLP